MRGEVVELRCLELLRGGKLLGSGGLELLDGLLGLLLAVLHVKLLLLSLLLLKCLALLRCGFRVGLGLRRGLWLGRSLPLHLGGLCRSERRPGFLLLELLNSCSRFFELALHALEFGEFVARLGLAYWLGRDRHSQGLRFVTWSCVRIHTLSLLLHASTTHGSNAVTLHVD